MNQRDDGTAGRTTPDLMDSEGSPDIWQKVHECFEDLATHQPFDPGWTLLARHVLDGVRRKLTDSVGRRRTDFVLKATAYLPLVTAAQEGNRYAQYVLARYYQMGFVLPDDRLAAFEALDAAAEYGDDGAAHAIEQIEIAGPSTESARLPQDKTPVAWSDLAAAYWFERAANQGLAFAQQELAWMYFKGWGVPIDYVAAYMWSNLAAVATYEVREVNSGRSVCFELKVNKYASFEQIAEAQQLTRKFVPKIEEQESE